MLGDAEPARSLFLDLSAPLDELAAARETGELAGRRLLLVGGQVAALLLAFAVLAAVGMRRDVEAAGQRLTWFGGRRWQVHLVTAAETFTVALSAGPSFASVEHEFARDVRVSETGGVPFDSVAISDIAFVRSSKTKATMNIGAKLVYELPFRLGDFGRLGASLGFRYAGGSAELDGASGPVKVKFGGPQVLGGVRVTF